MAGSVLIKLVVVAQALALLRPAARGPRLPAACLAKAKKKGKAGGGAKGFGAAPPPTPPAPGDGAVSDGGLRMDLAEEDGPAAKAPDQSELLATLLDEERARAAAARETVADLEARDAYVREQGVEAGRVPDSVANRMLFRMVTFAGVPLFGGVAVFVWFYFAATRDDNVFQPTLVASATTVPWVLALLGIGYGALSASWDEDEPGSALGLDEIKLNVGRLFEGLGRSAKDAALREKIDRDKK